MNMLIAMASLAMLSGSIFSSALAATRYVEGAWGDHASANDCRDRRTPCATIEHAISQAQPNDRVIVGPGSYAPATQIDFKPGLKLTSVAGAAATIVDATGLSSSYVFLAGFDPKAVLGQKRRGFTVIADNSVTQAMVWVNGSDGVRIEGNRFVSPINAVVSAIDITNSDNMTIRYNDISAIHGGSLTNGIRTFTLGGFDRNKKWNIAENRLQNILNCLSVGSTAVNNANKVVKNRLDDCREFGISVRNWDETLNPIESSRDRYMDNLIRMAYFEPYKTALVIDGGNPVVQRNSIDVMRGASDGIDLQNTRNAQLKDNVLLGPFGNPSVGSGLSVWGVKTSDATGDNESISLLGNTIQGFQDAVRVDLLEIKALKNNNLLNSSRCSFNLTSDTSPVRTLKASGNFWGDPLGLDTDQCSFVGNEVIDGDLSFNPSSRLKPIKFKDPFN